MSKHGNKLVGVRIADRYCITGEIGKGGMGVVYKAIPFDDPSHSVAIKVIQRTGRLGYDDLMRFQKEASLMSQLHHPNIVVFHELGLLDNGGGSEEASGGPSEGYYIVMEIADGTNLKLHLERDGRKDLAFFFQVGLQVSAALDYTHGKNIIHRDIKPHNIIVGQAFGDRRGVMVKVLDFGVARLAEAMREGGGGNAFEDAAGTPLYMAPEQTPLMDAPIDHRVDLYSLGCVLYELLAGKPPFTASSREKLEKQHVFAEPEPLTHLRPDVPPLVEQIVHKLLAKHPNDRYQTAFSLHADLLRAKGMFERAGRPQGISFPLGLKDRFQAVSARLALVGRDAELKTLVEEYDSVAKDKGRSRLMLIRGPAGIGKSRLMHEFQSLLGRRRVRFVSGQFSQHENALPFNALANAFNEYLYRVAKSYPAEAEEIRRRIKGTLGPEAHRIAEVVPGLKPYLAGVPEDDDAEDGRDGAGAAGDAPEAFAKFARAFSDFTKCLGTDNQPVVFLFHDLHWADEKSLDLIDTFFANANALRFYLVVSERTGIQTKNERFNNFIEKFRKLKRRFTQIELAQIERQGVQGIVGNMLAAPDSVTSELVTYLDEQARGNPMHLVELTRTLVARDLIHPRADTNAWEFDIKALKRTTIALNTIDLVLSRIHDYGEFDVQVLGVAATIGLTFQFETLLLGGRAQSVPVMKAVQRAMDDGLVVRVTDDPDLRHLGKTFMFAHKKARDAIYEAIDTAKRRELHRGIGEKLEAAVSEPTGKTLFALAHHFNSALDAGRTEDKSLAERCLRYNVRAGKEAYKSGSFETAERYYENAWKLMEAWGDKASTGEERARVRETLADLAALQRNPKQALAMYNDLLGTALPTETHASIAHKAVTLQLVGGVISETLRLIDRTLRQLGHGVPAKGALSAVKLAWSLAVDALPINYRKKRLYGLLAMAHAHRKHDQDKLDRRFPAVRLLDAGARAHLVDDAKRALAYHDAALKEALKGRGSAASLLRVVAERAAILGYFGATRVAYRFLDLAMDVARTLKLPATYGFVTLQRVLLLDYVKGRHEEVSDHLREVFRVLKPADDRVAYGQAWSFRIYRELMRCNFKDLYSDCQRMPDLIQTRNWMSPRWMAMMLYGYLLQGARANIVAHGEKFLKRRAKVQARGGDLFVRVINTQIAFARGEIDKTREWYQSTVTDFVARVGRSFLLPFEEDFIAMFAFTFPVVFEHEYGRHLMRAQEMELLLAKLRRRIGRLKGQDRAVPLLLQARAAELAGDTKHVRGLYDQALKAAKEGGTTLVHVFGYLWFGTHLLDHGHGQRRDYIRRAMDIASRHELRTIVEFVKKLAEKRDLQFRESLNLARTGAKTAGGRASAGAGALPSRLFVEHLNHVCEALDGETRLEEDIKASFAILSKHYASGRIWCVLTGRDGRLRVVYPNDADGVAVPVTEYVEPYVNIRSTLFLPLSDAPWAKVAPAPRSHQSVQSTAVLDLGVSGDPAASSSTSTGPTEDVASTMVMGGGDGGAVTEAASSRTDVPSGLTVGDDGTTQASRTVAQGDAGGTGGTGGAPGGGRGGAMPMSALVPMRSGHASLGVVYIEDIGPQSGRDTTLVHHELNQFGAQLGLLLERKAGFEVSRPTKVDSTAGSSGAAIYLPGSYTMEPVPWLKTWHHGRMREQRETSWIVGLNFGEQHYVFAYCLLSGQEGVRERLGSMIWHHVYAVRALSVASGRNQVDARELADEFRGLFTVLPKAAQLENISLAFTVVSREHRTALSGHFGPARPHVIGVENLVTPANDVVLTYANGRDLRYWDVVAELNEPHAYVLSYDTSKLDSAQVDTAKKREAVPGFLAALDQAGDLHRALTTLVPDEALPRYYVAAVLLPDAEASGGAGSRSGATARAVSVSAAVQATIKVENEPEAPPPAPLPKAQ